MDRNQFVYAKINKPYSPSIEAYSQKEGFYTCFNQSGSAPIKPKASASPVKAKAPNAPKAAPAGLVVKAAKHGDYYIAQLDTKTITDRPQVVFVDGEHTTRAVLSDFQFCSNVISKDGTILFHDFWFIYPAIYRICKSLHKQRLSFITFKLDDSVFGIFFDSDVVRSDPYLASLYTRNKNFLLRFRLKVMLRSVLPGPVWEALRGLRNLMKREST